jgi:hypothetical protein
MEHIIFECIFHFSIFLGISYLYNKNNTRKMMNPKQGGWGLTAVLLLLVCVDLDRVLLPVEGRRGGGGFSRHIFMLIAKI